MSLILDESAVTYRLTRALKMNEAQKKQSFNFFSLKTLIDDLQQLFIAVSGRLHQLNLDNHNKGSAKPAVDIWGKLGNFIETHPVESDAGLSLDAHLKQLGPGSGQHTPHHEKHNLDNYLDGGPRERGALGDFYQRQRVRVEVKPHMSEKMSRNTMDHINSSLHFAKNGDLEGARLHIELAESATHMASQFMSDSEYEDFKQKVHRRIQDIIENGRAPI